MAALLFPELQFNDNNTGSPLANGTVETFIAGTSTPAVTYTDNTGNTSVGTSVPLDANGRPNSGNGIWIESATVYKFIIKNSNGSTVQTIDNISAGGFNGSSSFVTAVAESGLTTARVLTTSTTNTIVDGGAGSTIQVQRTALTGDVTASANSNTTTIANNAVTTAKISDASVTLAKMANITTDSLIGRDTAGTGVPEVITLGASLSMTGANVLQRAALTGDVTCPANSNTTTIPAGQVTLAQMANIATATVIGRPVSGTGAPSAMTLGGGIGVDGTSVLQTQIAINSQTGASYTALAGDRGKQIIFTTQAAATLTLTAAATLGSGWYCYVTNFNTGTLTIDGNVSEQINGTVTVPLYTKNSGILICDGSNFKFLYSPLLDSNGVQFGDSASIRAGLLIVPTWATINYITNGFSSPTQLTANTDNLTITSSSVALASSAAWNLTGLSGINTDGLHCYLYNSSAFTITLKNDTTSTAENRFKFSTGADISLLTNQTIHLIYREGTVNRWLNVL